MNDPVTAGVSEPSAKPRSPPSTLLVEARDLHKSYCIGRRTLEVLRGLSLRVAVGEFLFRGEPVEENIKTSVAYFKRMSPLGMSIEIELGVTGGEEDGVTGRAAAQRRARSGSPSAPGDRAAATAPGSRRSGAGWSRCLS